MATEEQDLAQRRERERERERERANVPPMYGGGGSVPVPDPTTRTVEALAREIAALKELAFSKIASIEQAIQLFNDNLTRVPTALDKEVARLKEHYESRFQSVDKDIALTREVIQTRFDGNEKAVELLQNLTDKLPSRIDEKLAALQSMNEGQFKAIQESFIERDKRSEQSSRQSEVAISAALQAQKEAAAEQNRSFSTAATKAEVATDKRIDQQGEQIRSATGALRDQLDDVKDRITRLEGQALGRVEIKAETHSNSSLIIAIIGIGLAILSALIALSAFIRPK